MLKKLTNFVYYELAVIFYKNAEIDIVNTKTKETTPVVLMDIFEASGPDKEYDRGFPSASDAFTMKPEV